ncbi:MAG TPA: transporter substrate-binding domain-containing protein [Balneolales bacterium]|jgi:hypothetical protein|nr:transporter substrate-binding domain-containing protein [Balneolales bacterium]
MKLKKHVFLTVSAMIFWAVLFIAGPLYAQQNKVTLVRYYADPSDVITHFYYRKLLHMALEETEKQYGPFKMEPVMANVTQRVAFRHLRVGEGVDVVYSMMSTAREWVLRTIKVPLSKGYIGCRLIMVNQSDKNLFAEVTNKDQLNKFRLGQEYDWPDTQILESNGINVIKSQTYDSLFTMLENHTIDGFPRGVYEINYEIQHHPGEHLVVADGIYIKYPTDMFFYVKKDNLALAKRIREGLLAGMKDGSFDRIFKENVQPSIDAAHLDKRHEIKLANPQYKQLMQNSPLAPK